MREIDVIEDPVVAEVALAPLRAQLLSELATPASASTLGSRIGMPRQKVNYHLRALEKHGLIQLVEERRRGNMTEVIYQATAASYLISPETLADVAPDPDRDRDHLSATWLLALGARLVHDVGRLVSGARRANKRLATFAIDSEITFESASARAQFAAELAQTTADLVSRYHTDSAPNGRRHRLVIALHPSLKARTQAAIEPAEVTEPTK
ncbi:helix-turn-helix domain-containing protein [Kribbella sp. NPDC048915]|uniref:helix-turn-helix domain-containing protein n=1 Tax=Kribbella sp. NPDC048915 TaxID=3155148 RepID=UPI0033E1655A